MINVETIWSSKTQPTQSQLTCSCVDGVYVDDRHLLVQNFRPRLDQLPRLSVEAGALQEEPVDVDALGGRVVDVFLGKAGHEVLKEQQDDWLSSLI